MVVLRVVGLVKQFHVCVQVRVDLRCYDFTPVDYPLSFLYHPLRAVDLQIFLIPEFTVGGTVSHHVWGKAYVQCLCEVSVELTGGGVSHVYRIYIFESPGRGEHSRCIDGGNGGGSVLFDHHA